MHKWFCPQCELIDYCTECIYDRKRKSPPSPPRTPQEPEVIFQKLPPIKKPRA